MSGWGTACDEVEVARLVPLPCGVEDGSIDAIRVRPRGDFPSSRAISVLVGENGAELSDLADDVAGITVEGLFGDSLVEVVGRTGRYERSGELPVYFAPPDTLCPIAMPSPGRQVGALVSLANGAVIGVGGRDTNGRLLDDLVDYVDSQLDAEVSAAHLSVPATGQTVHAIEPEAALVIGGAGSNRSSLATMVEIVVAEDGTLRVGEPIAMRVGLGEPRPRAHHGAVTRLDGTILVAGGCARSLDGECAVGPDSVRSDALWIDGRGLTISEAPGLPRGRFGHLLLRGSDDVIVALGGFDETGDPDQTILVLLPGADAWAPYGAPLGEALAQDRAIVGGTLIEGGIVVLLVSDGRIVWVDETSRTAEAEGCGAELGPPCFSVAGETGLGLGRRGLVTLPGERVLVETSIVGAALLGLADGGSVELAPWSAGVQSVLLADGSALVVGGGDVDRGWIGRVRPPLDGPDETLPPIESLAPGSFVVHDPGGLGAPRVSTSGTTLVLDGDPAVPSDLLATWVHIRGFRSRQFRFEVDLEALRGARPWLVFPRGVVARVEIRFDEDAIRFNERSADGGNAAVTCARPGIDFSGLGRSIRVDVAPDAIAIRSEGRLLAQCPGISDQPVAVGLGMIGDGTIRASDFRLARN